MQARAALASVVATASFAVSCQTSDLPAHRPPVDPRDDQGTTIVLVPGFLGSRLEVTQEGGNDLVWGTVGSDAAPSSPGLEDRVLGGNIAALADALANGTPVREAGLLDSYRVGGSEVMPVYDPLLERLHSLAESRDPPYEVKVYPYDWTRSVWKSAVGLQRLLNQDPSRQYIIVAHSLGTLVTLAMIQSSEPSSLPPIRSIVLLKGPLRGSASAWDLLTRGDTGTPLLDIAKSSDDLERFAYYSESVWELLPISMGLPPQSGSGPMYDSLGSAYVRERLPYPRPTSKGRRQPWDLSHHRTYRELRKQDLRRAESRRSTPLHLDEADDAWIDVLRTHHPYLDAEHVRSRLALARSLRRRLFEAPRYPYPPTFHVVGRYAADATRRYRRLDALEESHHGDGTVHFLDTMPRDTAFYYVDSYPRGALVFPAGVVTDIRPPMGDRAPTVKGATHGIEYVGQEAYEDAPRMPRPEPGMVKLVPWIDYLAYTLEQGVPMPFGRSDEGAGSEPSYAFYRFIEEEHTEHFSSPSAEQAILEILDFTPVLGEARVRVLRIERRRSPNLLDPERAGWARWLEEPSLIVSDAETSRAADDRHWISDLEPPFFPTPGYAVLKYRIDGPAPDHFETTLGYVFERELSQVAADRLHRFLVLADRVRDLRFSTGMERGQAWVRAEFRLLEAGRELRFTAHGTSPSSRSPSLDLAVLALLDHILRISRLLELPELCAASPWKFVLGTGVVQDTDREALPLLIRSLFDEDETVGLPNFELLAGVAVTLDDPIAARMAFDSERLAPARRDAWLEQMQRDHADYFEKYLAARLDGGISDAERSWKPVIETTSFRLTDPPGDCPAFTGDGVAADAP